MVLEGGSGGVKSTHDLPRICSKEQKQLRITEGEDHNRVAESTYDLGNSMDVDGESNELQGNYR